MIEIIVWLVLYSCFSGCVLFIHYWYSLLRDRDNYSRDELVNFYDILMKQLNLLTSRNDMVINYGAIGIGIGFAWLLAFFGGLVSPDTSPAPDHASGQIPNYFFQSVLVLPILHVIWPSITDVIMDSTGRESIFAKFMDAPVPFMFGLSCSLAAINMGLWGVYFERGFLWSFINMLLALGYAFFRMLELEQPQEDAGGFEQNEEDY